VRNFMHSPSRCHHQSVCAQTHFSISACYTPPPPHTQTHTHLPRPLPPPMPPGNRHCAREHGTLSLPHHPPHSYTDRQLRTWPGTATCSASLLVRTRDGEKGRVCATAEVGGCVRARWAGLMVTTADPWVSVTLPSSLRAADATPSIPVVLAVLACICRRPPAPGGRGLKWKAGL
jgi:hypothetical protein